MNTINDVDNSHSAGSDGKESACNTGDLGLIPGLGRFPGEGMATHSSILVWKKSHGQSRLAGYSPWGHKESDTTFTLHHSHWGGRPLVGWF